MRLSTKIILGFAFIITFSIISFIVNLRLSEEVKRNTSFLENSEIIIRISGQVHKNIIEMQSGFRGFLLTNNERFLDPYYSGLKDVPTLINSQKKFISYSKKQLIKLDSIQNLHQQWIAYSSSLIEAKKKDSLEKDNKVYLFLFETKLQKEVGKKINDEISNKFREFDRYEYKVRQERRYRLNSSISNTKKVSYILSITTILIGVLGAIYITHDISRRISLMVGLAEGISKGKFESIEDKEEDELTNLSGSLNVMSEKLNVSFSELAKKNKELDQFAYVVSHDLKAPLRGMYNILNWIDEDLHHEISEPMKKYHEMLRGRIRRLETLISGLLEYARIGRTAKSYGDVNVKELLFEVKEMVVPQGFNLVIPDSLPVIRAEKVRLEQVFTNLIGNAVKHHGAATGNIIVEYKEEPDYHVFSVEDDGVGIAPEFHEKIFQIFQTLREKNQMESTGVGLAIVKKIIDDNKGTINVISAKGCGAKFVFKWPKESMYNINLN